MTPIQFQAELDLKAAGETNPIRVTILAYSGGEMSVPGYGPVVVDLDGVSAPDSVVILAEHEASLRSVLGAGKPEKRAGRLFVVGQLAGGELTARLVELQKSGVTLQASIGLQPKEQLRVKPGEKIQANGQTLTAGQNGLTYVTKGELREVSIVALGADSKTAVSIAAMLHRKEEPMTQSPTQTQPSQTEAETVKAERDRVSQIIAACAGNHPEIQAKAISEGWTIDQTKSELLDVIRASRPRSPGVSTFIDPGENNGHAIQAALLLRIGREAAAVKHYGERVVSAAKSIRANSMLDILECWMKVSGRAAPRDRSEMVRAAFSMHEVQEAFANVTGKLLMDSYAEATATWRGFAKVLPAADFKPQKSIRPSSIGDLEPLGADGLLKHGELAESTIPWSIDTFGKIFRFTRKDAINDDLGFLESIPELFGKAAARAVNDLVYKTLLAATGTSHFSVGNKNYIVGAATNLQFSSLQDAIALIRLQRDAKNADLNIVPQVLLVPPELEVTARSLLNSTDVYRTGDRAPSGNPFLGMLQLAVEPRLSNTAKFSQASLVHWFVMAGPMDAPVVVGFLDGNEAPKIEFFGLDQNQDQLGMAYRCYHDFGAAKGDPKAAVYVKGQA